MDQAGEEFEAFYVAQWPRVAAALRLALPEGEEPEDVAQEAFTRAFEQWDHLRHHPRPDGWLFLTAYRLATSLRRRTATRLRSTGSSAASPALPADSLTEALASLTQRQRAALLLRHHYGFSTRETAQVLRCREGTVKSLLAHARERLVVAMTPEKE